MNPNKAIEKDISEYENDSLSYYKPNEVRPKVSSREPKPRRDDASCAASVAIQMGFPVIKEFRTHLTRFLAEMEVRCLKFIVARQRSVYKY